MSNNKTDINNLSFSQSIVIAFLVVFIGIQFGIQFSDCVDQTVATKTASSTTEQKDKPSPTECQTSPAKEQTPEPAKEQTPEPAKEDNYLEVTSPENMKKDAIRDVNILLKALANVNIDQIDNTIFNEYTWPIAREYKHGAFNCNGLFAILAYKDIRTAVLSKMQKGLNLPASQISNRQITGHILNDVRYFVKNMELNNAKWNFYSFSGDLILLSHDLPKNNLNRQLVENNLRVTDPEYVLNKVHPNKVLIYKRSDVLYDEEVIFIAGIYSSTIKHWIFDITDLFSMCQIMSKDKNTLYFSEFPTMQTLDLTARLQRLTDETEFITSKNELLQY